MTYYEKFMLITTVLSAVAAVGSCFSAIITLQISKKFSNAQIEVYLTTILMDAKKEFRKEVLAYKNQVEDDDSGYLMAIEELLNAYNEACSKYLQKKVNKKWFNGIYDDEIKKITAEDTKIKVVFESDVSQFQSIREYITVKTQWML